MPPKAYNWNMVSDYLRENTQAGMLMAVLEADKILISVLRDLEYPGENDQQKIGAAQKLFSDFKRVKRAHYFARKIKREINFFITTQVCEEILAVYYQALSDIKEHKRPRFNLFQKIIFYFRKKILKAKKIFKWILTGIALFFLAALFLDKTKIGQKTVAAILTVTNFIFSWLSVLILLLCGIITLALASIWYFKTRRKVDMDINIP